MILCHEPQASTKKKQLVYNKYNNERNDDLHGVRKQTRKTGNDIRKATEKLLKWE
jgi:hypothetical protein